MRRSPARYNTDDALADYHRSLPTTPLTQTSNYINKNLNYVKRKFQNSEFGSAAQDLSDRVKSSVSSFADDANSKIHTLTNTIQVEGKRLPVRIKDAVSSGVAQFKDNLGHAIYQASHPISTFKNNASADINRTTNFVKQGASAVRQGIKSVTGFKKGGQVKKKGKYLVHKKEYILPKKVKPTKSQKLRVAKRNKNNNV